MDPDEIQFDHDEAIVTAREWLSKEPVYLDTETTGLGADAQIVDIAIINAKGETILNTLICPTVSIPEAATAVHHINDAMVSGAPTFDVLWPFLCSLLKGRAVIAYNADFDFRMITQSVTAYDKNDANRILVENVHPHCAMQLYALFYGDYSEWHGSYKWQRLENAIRQCGLAVIQGETHRALYDAQLARSIVLHMAGQKTEDENATT